MPQSLAYIQATTMPFSPDINKNTQMSYVTRFLKQICKLCNLCLQAKRN